MSATHNLYRFSPITTKEQFDKAISYVVREATRLAKELTGSELPLSSVKIFSHYPEEWEFMQSTIEQYGARSTVGRSTSIYVDTDLDVEGSHITLLGIRVPDPYRSQVGCGDYALDDAKGFISSLPAHPHRYVRPFPNMPETFIELWHPDFDVAGYIDLEIDSK
jgi:hypothetical protein